MTVKKHTSITQAAAAALSSGDGPATLHCRLISGFHLKRTKTGASWRLRYTDTRGRRRVATIGRLAELTPAAAAQQALEWRLTGADPLSDKQGAQAAAQAAEQQQAARTLGAYLSGPYGQHQAHKRDGQSTLGRIRNHFPSLLTRDMASITRADLEAWQDEKKGLPYSSAQRILGALQTLLNHAVKNDMLSENPIKGFELRKPNANDKAERKLERTRKEKRLPFTDDEIERIYSALEQFAEQTRQRRRNSRAHGKPHLQDLDEPHFAHWFEPFLLMALHTGMRMGDLYAIRWNENLNLQFGRLVFTPRKTADHADPVQVDLPIRGEIQTAMRNWWGDCGQPDSGLVFQSPRTRGEMASSAHKKPWAKVAQLAGIEGRTMYATRHNFISRLVAEGVPALTVARLVGHRSTGMIERHYGHLMPSKAADALAVLSRGIQRDHGS